MNKFILYQLIAITCFFSCKSEKKYGIADIQSITTAVEKIVDRCDNNIQSAIDSKNFDYIVQVSASSMDLSNIKLENLKSLQLDSSLEDLRSVSVSYIQALQQVIAAQQIYAYLTDSVSDKAAREMDYKLLQAVQNAQLKNIKYTSIIKDLSSK